MLALLLALTACHSDKQSEETETKPSIVPPPISTETDEETEPEDLLPKAEFDLKAIYAANRLSTLLNEYKTVSIRQGTVTRSYTRRDGQIVSFTMDDASHAWSGSYKTFTFSSDGAKTADLLASVGYGADLSPDVTGQNLLVNITDGSFETELLFETETAYTFAAAPKEVGEDGVTRYEYTVDARTLVPRSPAAEDRGRGRHDRHDRRHVRRC